MDNGKDWIVLDSNITLKQDGNPIICCMHEKIKRHIAVAETDQLVLIKLNIIGEIEITKGDKKYTKEVDFVVDIGIDESGN